ncbi:MAG: basic secretory protein-like protein [Luteolibacter sp.]|uniref:basic secretory protein-like protein n=1 Tax=Luteolibacter sp. TaxID=1962973 RepID=UPI00326654E5
MKTRHPFAIVAALLAAPLAQAAVKVEIGFSEADKGFKLDPVPPPASNDAATAATFTLVDGERDGNGGDLAALHDGKIPGDADEPTRNFFFQNGSNGGRIEVDLGKPVSIKSIQTYSWHPRSRGPQVYKLYAATGNEPGFKDAPKRDTDPRTSGWKPVAKVDTRKKGTGGQHAASISESRGAPLGEFRYLLFDIEKPTEQDGQSNTFFSEIDVIDAKGPAPEAIKVVEKIVKTYPSPDKKFTYIVDASAAPDLMKWVESELIPMVKIWYPKMADMLPSDQYQVPSTFQLTFKDDMPSGVPAYAQGNQLSISTSFCRSQLQGEAKGCVIHEMVHVIQNYWIAGKINKHPTQTPTWVGEAIADYIRWFLYEPKSKGAEITAGNFGGAKFDSSYRISANFLNWIVETHDKEFIQKLNAAAREGTYSEKIWQDATGKSVEELGEDWKKANAKRLGI